ncbi:MAG: hypothetical protein HON90_12475 [Halobacteriovoraceae bacterium]|jgi:hypothetical protein|nr:hypothetical protein [Halobacteriovoraceae bacterium]
MKTLLIFVVLINSAFAAICSSPKKNDNLCLSAREYITTLGFLRDRKEFGLNEAEIQKTSDSVSQGCSGASQRFINITKLLTKLGIDTRSSIKYALKFTAKSDKETKAFVEIFKNSYNPGYLDLDVLTSLKLSLKLANSPLSNVDNTLSDFKNLVHFCLNNQSMDLSKPACAKIATDITLLGQKFNQKLAKPFTKLMFFLQDNKSGPKLNRGQALAIAQEVIQYGPLSFENFKQAFKLSLSKKGLNRSIQKSLVFAKKIAKRSLKETVKK